MDVSRSLLAVALIFALSACSNTKSADTVFPENGALDSSACMGQALQTRFIVQWEDGRFTTETAANAEDFKKNFIEPQLQDIKYVEHDRMLKLEAESIVRTNVMGDSWGQDMIQARALWAAGIKGQNIKVAVVDSYVDVQHPQILPRIAINTGEIPNNGIDDDGNGVIDDVYGASFVPVSDNTVVSSHGTHVTGIIAADPNFGPIEGVAPLSKIIPAQFISNDGGGSLGDAVLSLQYAAQRGARVINASWGGAPCVASLREAFKSLEDKGILIVVAAGNDGRDIDLYPEFPASFSFSNQITVAASSVTDFMTAWSNRGFGLVNLGAPGESILSTVPGGGSAYMDGTSMAAPFVSGAAALIWSDRPQATAQQVRKALLESVDVTSGHEFKTTTRGRLNVSKALTRLRQLVP